MIRFDGYTISMQEVPGEIAMVFNITGCGLSCSGCHSPYLRHEEGFSLDTYMDVIVPYYKGMITCVCFMGDGNDLLGVERLARHVQEAYGLKTCLYTGSEDFLAFKPLLPVLSFLKTGPYIATLGGLDNPTTNQRFYRVHPVSSTLDDLTHLFYERKSKQ